MSQAKLAHATRLAQQITAVLTAAKELRETVAEADDSGYAHTETGITDADLGAQFSAAIGGAAGYRKVLEAAILFEQECTTPRTEGGVSAIGQLRRARL